MKINTKTKKKEEYVAPKAEVIEVKLDQSFLQMYASTTAEGFEDGGYF